MDTNISNFINNGTNLTTDHQRIWTNDIINYLYALVGTLAVITNCVIICVFLIGAKLRRRKELLLLVGLAVADLIYSIGTLVKGYRRIYVDEYHVRIQRLECMKRIETTLTIFGIHCSPLMTLSISVDRLLATKWYKWYQNIPRGVYVLCIVGSAFVCPIISNFIGFALVTHDADYCRCSKNTHDYYILLNHREKN